MTPRPLTARQSKFVDAYITGIPAAQAARQAGYAPTVACRAASHILTSPAVAEAVRDAQQTLREAAVYGANEAVAELDELLTFARKKGNPMAAAKLLELKLKLFGLLTDRVEFKSGIDMVAIMAEAKARALAPRVIEGTATDASAVVDPFSE